MLIKIPWDCRRLQADTWRKSCRYGNNSAFRMDVLVHVTFRIRKLTGSHEHLRPIIAYDANGSRRYVRALSTGEAWSDPYRMRPI